MGLKNQWKFEWITPNIFSERFPSMDIPIFHQIDDCYDQWLDIEHKIIYSIANEGSLDKQYRQRQEFFQYAMWSQI